MGEEWGRVGSCVSDFMKTMSGLDLVSGNAICGKVCGKVGWEVGKGREFAGRIGMWETCFTI